MAAFDPRRFGEILRLPGAAAFTSAGFLGRLALSAATLAITLVIVDRTGSYALAGLIVAVFVVSRAASGPILGRLVDRHGQFAVMLTASMGQVVMLIVMTLAILSDWPIAAIAVIAGIAGFGSGAPPALVRARWAALVGKNPAQLSTAFAWESLIESTAFTVAPLIVVMLVNSTSPLVGLVFVIGVVLAAGLTLYLQKRTQPPVVLTSAGTAQPVGGRTIGLVITCAIYYFAVSFAMGAFDIVAVQQGEASGIPGFTGIAIACFSLGTLIGGVVYGSLQWKWTPHQRMWGIVPLFALSTLLVPLLGQGLPLLLSGALIGLFFTSTLTSTNLTVQSVAPKGRLTELLAYMTAGFGGGVAGGNYFAGLAVDHGGFAAASWVVAGAGALGLLAMAVDLAFFRKPIAAPAAA